MSSTGSEVVNIRLNISTLALIAFFELSLSLPSAALLELALFEFFKSSKGGTRCKFDCRRTSKLQRTAAKNCGIFVDASIAVMNSWASFNGRCETKKWLKSETQKSRVLMPLVSSNEFVDGEILESCDLMDKKSSGNEGTKESVNEKFPLGVELIFVFPLSLLFGAPFAFAFDDTDGFGLGFELSLFFDPGGGIIINRSAKGLNIQKTVAHKLSISNDSPR